MPLSVSSCNLVISSVSPGEIGLLPSDKETKGQEEQGRQRGWLGSGETHKTERRADRWGVVCFQGAGDQAKALCTLLPEMHLQ